MPFEVSTLTPRKCVFKTPSQYIPQTAPLKFPTSPHITHIARTPRTIMPTRPRIRPRRRPQGQTNSAPGGQVPHLQAAYRHVYLGLRAVMLLLLLVCCHLFGTATLLLLNAMGYPLRLTYYLQRVQHLLLAQRLLRLYRELRQHLPIETLIKL